MMKIFTRFSTYTLLVALAISAVAEFYSIVGLATIFSGAVIPIVIMGVVLGLGKLTATIWLKLNWDRASFTYKLYLIPAICVLMFLTSMGIFGYLSRAHSDQNQISGDALSKVAIYDEKIKTAKENIEADRRQLKQMDEAVDQVMARSTTEEGAAKSNAIRRAQARDRTALAKSIEANQKLIGALNDEAAPLRAEVRKVEAEVGPIKYIAAIIYGDNPDANLLEAAVRWVIIIIVAVFDPLALILLLAAQQSMRWERQEQEQEENTPDPHVADVGEKPEQKPESEEDKEEELQQFFTRARLVARGLDADEERRLADEANAKIAEIEPTPQYEQDDGPLTDSQLEQIVASVEKPALHPFEEYPYLEKKFTHFGNIKPQVYRRPEPTPEPVSFKQDNYQFSRYVMDELKLPQFNSVAVAEAVAEAEVKSVEPTADSTVEIPVTQEPKPESSLEAVDLTQRVEMFHPEEKYVSYDGKQMSIEALRGLRPDLIMSANSPLFEINWGTAFPRYARTGDIYVRVDAVPHRVYKFNGTKWIIINKDSNDTYLQNINYLQFLISKLSAGEYDPEILTEYERERIAEYLEKIKS